MPYEVINSIQVLAILIIDSLRSRLTCSIHVCVQNPMATHGDRKLFKVAVIANVNQELVSYLFDRYSELTAEHPDTAKCVYSKALSPHSD